MTQPALFPRKAPRQSRSAATVSAILEAAAHILDQRGLEGYNTNAVAARAGVSIGSLYQYFPGKDALTVTLIRRDHEALLAALAAAVERTRGAGLAEGLAALARVAVDHQLDRPRLARLLDVEEDRLPISRDSRATIAAIAAQVETFLEQHLAPPDREHLAVTAADLLAIARGIIDTAAQGPIPDRHVLARRVQWALAGYLEQMNGSSPGAGRGVQPRP